jgi:hypothetical protein
MAGLIRTRALALGARTFSTSATARGFAKEPDWDMRNDSGVTKYMWDEATTIGYIRLAAIDDIRQLVANMYTDTAALNGECGRGRPHLRPPPPPRLSYRLPNSPPLAALAASLPRPR